MYFDEVLNLLVLIQSLTPPHPNFFQTYGDFGTRSRVIKKALCVKLHVQSLCSLGEIPPQKNKQTNKQTTKTNKQNKTSCRTEGGHYYL